ncbi:hypothetical protein C6P46_005573 [Rhodotorula mucilaginosa]|uniref:C3H1-type domain-containing protein n=1 Tax=Rhodotorula mucilaginosa TaxID=5537 RepID=A0A9P7B596_RHOMI|nr:hypothetical protein C6P46_005573 [Rhodotorula mucilaginosa]
MADSDPAVLAEIARLERTGRGRGRGRGRGGPRTRGGGPPGHASYKNATWVAPTPASDAATPAPPTPSTSTIATAAPAPAPAPEPRQVTIDGVVFVAHPRGNKLVRKPTQEAAAQSTAAPPASEEGGGHATPAAAAADPPSTPRRLSHLGTTYIRTKTGNLVSLAFARKQKELADARRAQMDHKRERLERLVGVVKSVQGARNSAAAARGGGGGRGGGRRGGYGGKGGATSRRLPKPKSDKLCRFFQRTGQCSRAHTCPYVHDSHKVAICPLFLRSACPRPASQCPLSHSPNAHRSPHCVHFPNCTRGDACPYAHIKVSVDAVPCREFVEVGWLGCREPHVLRRTHTASEEEEEGPEEDDEDEEDDDEAINELIEDAVEMNEAERVFGDGSTTATTDSKGKGKKRSRRDSAADAPGLVGISGAAGRQLKRLKDQEDEAAARRKRRVFAGQDDFVTLEMPLSSDEEDEDEEDEASSVDSEDLAAEEEEEEDVQNHLPAAITSVAPDAAAAAAATATAATLTKPGTARPRATDLLDQDALDYGDDDGDG